MRRNFRTGDVLISRQPQPAKVQQEISALQSKRPVVIKDQAPSFKTTAPAPRTFLGIQAFKAQELREKGIKIDLGSTKIKIPVLDDQGNEIKDTDGNVIMKEKVVRIADVGGSIIDKIDKLAELMEGTQQEIRDNRIAIVANLQGILARGDGSQLTAGELAIVVRAVRASNISTAVTQSSMIARRMMDPGGRFVINLGPSAPSPVDPRRMVRDRGRGQVGILLASIINQASDNNVLGKDNTNALLTMDFPAIGVTGAAINLRSIFAAIDRGNVLNPFARDATGRITPRMFVNLAAARANRFGQLRPGRRPEGARPVVVAPRGPNDPLVARVPVVVPPLGPRARASSDPGVLDPDEGKHDPGRVPDPIFAARVPGAAPVPRRPGTPPARPRGRVGRFLGRLGF